MEFNDGIYKNLFDVTFSTLKGLKEVEYNLLKDTFQEMDKESITFNLVEVSEKVQPLEIIVKLISNKIVGNLVIDLHNKDGLILGKISFKNFVFKKIEDLIDFNFRSEESSKELKVLYEYDEIIYSGKSGKEEKIG